jgi:hypothetical protein
LAKLLGRFIEKDIGEFGHSYVPAPHSYLWMGGHSKRKVGFGADSYDQKAKLGASTRSHKHCRCGLAEVTIRR